jgi:hypothetical protein
MTLSIKNNLGANKTPETLSLQEKQKKNQNENARHAPMKLPLRFSI